MGVVQERLMQLPDSKLGEMLRARKAGKSGTSLYENLRQDSGIGSALSLKPFQSATDVYSDEIHQVHITHSTPCSTHLIFPNYD